MPADEGSGVAAARWTVSSGACPFLHELGRARGEAYAVQFALAPTRPVKVVKEEVPPLSSSPPSGGCPRHLHAAARQANDASADPSGAAFAASLHAFHGADGVLPLPRVVAGRSLAVPAAAAAAAAPPPPRTCPFRAALLGSSDEGGPGAAAVVVKPAPPPSSPPRARSGGVCPFDHRRMMAAAAAEPKPENADRPTTATATPSLPPRRQALPPAPLPLASMTLGGGGFGGMGEFFERLKRQQQQQKKKAQQQARRRPAAGGNGGTGGSGGNNGPGSTNSNNHQPPASRKPPSPAPGTGVGGGSTTNGPGFVRGPPPPGALGGGAASASSSAAGAAAGGGCPLRAWLGPMAGLVFDRYDRLVCPQPIVQARAALARTPPVRALRPRALPLKLLAVAAVAAAANLPCGAAREHFVKFSLGWVVAVHATVPFVAMLRKAVVMPPGAMVVTIAAAIAGQAVGARWERERLEKQGRRSVAASAAAAGPQQQQQQRRSAPVVAAAKKLQHKELSQQQQDGPLTVAAIAAGLAAAAAAAR